MLLFDFSDTSGAIRHWVLCQSIKVEGQQPLGTWVLFRLCWLPQGETGGVLASSQPHLASRLTVFPVRFAERSLTALRSPKSVPSPTVVCDHPM